MDLEGFYFKINIMNYNENLDLVPVKYFCEFDQIWKVEEFRDIPNYEKSYQVSDLGRVKSLSRLVNNSCCSFLSKEKVLKQEINDGYFRVDLCLNGNVKKIKVHQLVAIAFLKHIPCGFKLVINHKNFIKTDNRKLNLEIVTSRENSNLKHIKSTSKYTGVCWNIKSNKWHAQIIINKKRIHLGYFINEMDAHNAYQNALKNLK